MIPTCGRGTDISLRLAGLCPSSSSLLKLVNGKGLGWCWGSRLTGIPFFWHSYDRSSLHKHNITSDKENNTQLHKHLWGLNNSLLVVSAGAGSRARAARVSSQSVVHLFPHLLCSHLEECRLCIIYSVSPWYSMQIWTRNVPDHLEHVKHSRELLALVKMIQFTVITK